MAATVYRGRFAPSPTGPLHFGSLIAALAGYLHARHAGGEWLLRMEDIDPPREVPGAGDRILYSLERHGLFWDGPVSYQSRRGAHYDAALARLEENGALFACGCTRAILGPGGSCGRRCAPGAGDPIALRVGLDPRGRFTDLILGPQEQSGPLDQVLKRKDGLYAYALAVVVDDGLQGISHVLRGRDLLDQTTAQRQLHHLLGNPVPDFGHLPLLVGSDGHKLSKQTGAAPLDDSRPVANLRRALGFLNQAAAGSSAETVDDLLAAAVRGWDADAVASLSARIPVYPPPSTT